MNTPVPSSDSAPHARAGSSLWNRGGLTFAQVFHRIWSRFKQDRMLDQSAKLALYCVLSAFPFLFFLMTVFGLVMHAQPDFQATLQEYLMAVIPGSASGVVGNALDEIASSAGGGQVSLALIFTLWTASRCVVALTEGLNIAYDVEDARPWWKKNAVALGLTQDEPTKGTHHLVPFKADGKQEDRNTGNNRSLIEQRRRWEASLPGMAGGTSPYVEGWRDVGWHAEAGWESQRPCRETGSISRQDGLLALDALMFSGCCDIALRNAE